MGSESSSLNRRLEEEIGNLVRNRVKIRFYDRHSVEKSIILNSAPRDTLLIPCIVIQSRKFEFFYKYEYSSLDEIGEFEFKSEDR